MIGLLLVFVMAGLAAAFMQATVRGSAESLASGNQARVLYVAEAGVNDAIVDLRAGGDGNIGAKASLVSFGGGGYWVESIDHGDDTFTITSNGRLANEKRAVEIVLAPEEEKIFTRALFGDLDLGASGSVTTDSYESDLGTYASQAVNVHGPTGISYAKANGCLGSNGDIVLHGNVTILGDATPGAGHAVNVSGGGVYVEGSTAPAPVAEALPPVEYNPPIPMSSAFSTTANQTITAGTYRYASFSAGSHATITFEGEVTLYVDGDLDVTGQAELVVAPGASVTLYHGGTDFRIGGGGAVNHTDIPRNFRIYSTAEDVSFNGNSEFYGAIYAPNATIDPGGTSDVYGSFVGRSIYVGGTASFHFDEALSKNPDTRSTLKVVSWRRVAAAEN